MKTKLIIAALVCALSINAARAETQGSLGVMHTSDYYYRGAQLSQDALQFNVGVDTTVSGLGVSIGYFTNQASEDTNTDILSLDISKSILDKTLTLAAGVYNMDTDGTPDLTEAYVGVSANVLLNPSIKLFRDVSDDLYTCEVGISHKFDLQVVDLTVGGAYGRTELTDTTERDYTTLRARLSKSFDNVTPHVQVAVVDSDAMDSETVLCLGVDFKF